MISAGLSPVGRYINSQIIATYQFYISLTTPHNVLTRLKISVLIGKKAEEFLSWHPIMAAFWSGAVGNASTSETQP